MTRNPDFSKFCKAILRVSVADVTADDRLDSEVVGDACRVSMTSSIESCARLSAGDLGFPIFIPLQIDQLLDNHLFK